MAAEAAPRSNDRSGPSRRARDARVGERVTGAGLGRGCGFGGPGLGLRVGRRGGLGLVRGRRHWLTSCVGGTRGLSAARVVARGGDEGAEQEHEGGRRAAAHGHLISGVHSLLRPLSQRDLTHAGGASALRSPKSSSARRRPGSCGRRSGGGTFSPAVACRRPCAARAERARTPGAGARSRFPGACSRSAGSWAPRGAVIRSRARPRPSGRPASRGSVPATPGPWGGGRRAPRRTCRR